MSTLLKVAHLAGGGGAAQCMCHRSALLNGLCLFRQPSSPCHHNSFKCGTPSWNDALHAHTSACIAFIEHALIISHLTSARMLSSVAPGGAHVNKYIGSLREMTSYMDLLKIQVGRTRPVCSLLHAQYGCVEAPTMCTTQRDLRGQARPAVTWPLHACPKHCSGHVPHTSRPA